jgi:hypothetical protein
MGRISAEFWWPGTEWTAWWPENSRTPLAATFCSITNDWRIASTLNPRTAAVKRANLLHTKDAGMLSDGEHEYSWSRQPLQDITGKKAAEAFNLRSFEDDERRMADLSTSILRL